MEDHFSDLFGSLIFSESICLQAQRPLVTLTYRDNYEVDTMKDFKSWMAVGARWGAIYRFNAEKYRNDILRCRLSCEERIDA